MVVSKESLMGNLVDNKFTWVIQNFNSLQSTEICSDQFVIGGCKWELIAYPKGDDVDGYLSLFLGVAEYELLPRGWMRHAKVSFTLVNQLSEKLSQKGKAQHWFHEKCPSWGFSDMTLLTELQEKDCGFIVNRELMITAEVDVIEVLGKLDETEEYEETTQVVSCDLLNKTNQLNECIEVNGFLVLPSQVDTVKRIFEKHPDLAPGVHKKSPHLRTTYMNVLLGLIKSLCQSPHDLSNDDLKEASATVSYLANIGFKVDWLVKKLIELCDKKTKLRTVEIRLPGMEEKLLNLNKKLSDLKAGVAAAKIPLSFDDIVIKCKPNYKPKSSPLYLML